MKDYVNQHKYSALNQANSIVKYFNKVVINSIIVVVIVILIIAISSSSIVKKIYD